MNINILYPNGHDIIYRKASDLAHIFGVDKSEIWGYFSECFGLPEKDADKIVLLRGGQYDWGHDVFKTPIEKLNYIYTYIITTTAKQFLYEDNRYIRLRGIVDNMTGLLIFPDYFRFLFEGGYDDDPTFFEEQVRYFMDYGSLHGFKATKELSDGNTVDMHEIDTLSSDIYIDHQSVDLLDSYFKDDSDDALKNLIFTDEHKIFTNNDKH